MAFSLLSSLWRSDGEGDRTKCGGGAGGAVRPSTMLRMVPLPMGFAHREDW
jgi:hypothetical protein